MLVIFEDVAANELTPAQAQMVGSEQGRLLRFKNAILVRAERNRNWDRITEANIRELAESLPLTALDLEHRTKEIVGFFTDARAIQDTIDQKGNRVETTALATDGVIFADRYPEVARDVISGAAQLSIEADAEQARCSICSRVFAPDDTYCEHLSSMAAKRMYAAERTFTRMVAAGGGVTLNPAGTETRFDHNHVQFVASLATEPSAILASSITTAPETEEAVDTQKAERAERAARRLVANFVGDVIPGSAPSLTLFRPVLSPLLYVQDPAFIAEIVSKVRQSIAADLQIAAEPVKPITEAAPVAENTREEMKQVVAEQLAAKDEEESACESSRTQEGTTEPEPVVAASEHQAPSVGLVGFAWDTPTKPHTSIQAVWE